MTLDGWFQILLFCALVLALAKPLGGYLTRVLNGDRTLLSPILRPVERLLYRAAGVREDEEQGWIAYALALLAFNLAAPISQLAGTVTRATLGIALASVLLSFLMMITRSKAIAQVVGFLAMENGLFFAATAAVYGMPMVVELGVALDVLVAALILGVFLFQIRSRFDSVDTRHLERLKEE